MFQNLQALSVVCEDSSPLPLVSETKKWNNLDLKQNQHQTPHSLISHQ